MAGLDGYERVRAILPAHQAYQVKKWAEAVAAKLKDKQTEAAPVEVEEKAPARGEVFPYPEGFPTNPQHHVEATEAFSVGLRCRIERVHHKVFINTVGQHIIITRVHPDTRQVWAHDDKPTRYKYNQRGRQVLAYDPRCIQSCYSMNDISIIRTDQESSK